MTREQAEGLNKARYPDSPYKYQDREKFKFCNKFYYQCIVSFSDEPLLFTFEYKQAVYTAVKIDDNIWQAVKYDFHKWVQRWDKNIYFKNHEENFWRLYFLFQDPQDYWCYIITNKDKFIMKNTYDFNQWKEEQDKINPIEITKEFYEDLLRHRIKIFNDDWFDGSKTHEALSSYEDEED